MSLPYVILSCAMSIDGYIDSSAPERLILSNSADLDRIDALRASCDAILVGAGTIRADNPRLLIQSADLRAQRRALGLAESPLKVTISKSGELDPDANFFAQGSGGKLVYTADSTPIAKAVAVRGSVIRLSELLELQNVLVDLGRRGVSRILVEGGTEMHTQFLTQNLADELQLVIAPFLIGDSSAPRFVGPGKFPHDAHLRARLMSTTSVGDCALLRYGLSERCPSDPFRPA
ncbi:MAG: RibD family protein [Angustibacter sp.]